MINFKLFFENHTQKSYHPRAGDVFYHGSLNDYDPKDVLSKSEDRKGLIYVTRDLRHAMQYAQGIPENFGGEISKNGFIYSFKIKPDVNIFNATNKENFKGLGLDHTVEYKDKSGKDRKYRHDFDPKYGYTEIIQDPNLLDKILNLGYDGILQKQADLDHYGYVMPKRVKRHEYDKSEDRGKRRQKWNQNVKFGDNYDLFRGVSVLGILPSKLIPLKKFPIDEIDYRDLNNRGLHKFK